MEEGKTKSVTVPPEEAYGHYKEDLIFVIERSNIPDHIDPELGMRLKSRTLEGKIMEVTVKDIDEETVTLDGNHPFAGKDIVLEIKFLEIC